ncbi:hypothetical protein DV737_g5630, partial [Chaetothyriales sp. CBS 132003]
MAILPESDIHTFHSGHSQPSFGSPTFQSVDPSTAQSTCTIHTSSHASIDAAIASAQKAFPEWSNTPPPDRARILLRAASLLRERNDILARIETTDTGKPYSETSTVDIVTGADVLEYYAHLIASGGLNGESFRLRPTAWVYTTKDPLGVCAGIGAWNYPIQIALWKSGPCLAAGNCMVYKPSEVTPLHAQHLAEIYKEAGLPDGVFNVVYGAGDVGAYLTKHPAIAKVSFTGQVSTGRKVAGSAAGEMKYVTMELGGKSACVILDDCDVEKAVDGAMMANFFSTGQVCTNGTRVFVPRRMKEQFQMLLLEKIEYIRAGDLLDPNTNFGPLISETHYKKVVSYIKHGIKVDKATLLCGGLGQPKGVPSRLQSGYWVRPTVFTDCTDSMRIVREEIFGPVMSILTYDTIEEVISRANNSEVGLAAGVFGRDIDSLRKGDKISFIYKESPDSTAQVIVSGFPKRVATTFSTRWAKEFPDVKKMRVGAIGPCKTSIIVTGGDKQIWCKILSWMLSCCDRSGLKPFEAISPSDRPYSKYYVIRGYAQVIGCNFLMAQIQNRMDKIESRQIHSEDVRSLYLMLPEDNEELQKLARHVAMHIFNGTLKSKTSYLTVREEIKAFDKHVNDILNPLIKERKAQQKVERESRKVVHTKFPLPLVRRGQKGRSAQYKLDLSQIGPNKERQHHRPR